MKRKKLMKKQEPFEIKEKNFNEETENSTCKGIKLLEKQETPFEEKKLWS